MFRLVALAGLCWLGYRIVQENSAADDREPVALLPRPSRRPQAERPTPTS
jgi:hypothetical protein